MRLHFHAVIWSIGVLGVGCQSQGNERVATVSLEAQAEEAARAYAADRVDLLPAAGSGAEEDGPAEESDEDARVPAETSSPDGGLEAIEEAIRSADDSPLCGNGELDEGELCDFGILEGEGSCPDHCDPKPGCPDETLVIHGCDTRCMAEEEPSEECLAAQ